MLPLEKLKSLNFKGWSSHDSRTFRSQLALLAIVLIQSPCYLKGEAVKHGHDLVILLIVKEQSVVRDF